jgi:CheY-like chemotaxis protein
MSLRLLVIVPDLFFWTRIESTAASLGADARYATLDEAIERCRIEPPDRLILDLHAPGDPLGLVRAIRADARTSSIEVVGFYSHVDQGLRAAALEAGVNRVMPRSAFTARLPEILGGDVT